MMGSGRRTARDVQRELRERRRCAELKRMRRTYLICCAATAAVLAAVVAVTAYEVVRHH